MIVRIYGEHSESRIVGRGVRQGCLLSPLLFPLYAEFMMKDAMDAVKEGIKVGGKLVKDVRFADDQGMVASTRIGLQRMMDALSKTAKEYGMKINVEKTKVMVVSRTGGETVSIYIDGRKVEAVSKFKYLGAWITDDGRCEVDIKVRIAMAKEAFNKRKELLTRRMRLNLKKRIIKTLIWSVLLYGAESWSLRKKDVKKLEAFEMWIWRRIEKISWKDHISNKEVLKRVKERRSLIETIIKRK